MTDTSDARRGALALDRWAPANRSRSRAPVTRTTCCTKPSKPCTVLAIQGDDDEFFSGEQLERLATPLETLRLPGGGHYPQHQARDEMLAAVAGFVRGLDAAGGAAARATERLDSHTHRQTRSGE